MFLQEETDTWFVFASYAGGPKDPAWYHNVVANPDLDISVGDGMTISRVPVHAWGVRGEERDATYAKASRPLPGICGLSKTEDPRIYPSDRAEDPLSGLAQNHRSSFIARKRPD